MGKHIHTILITSFDDAVSKVPAAVEVFNRDGLALFRGHEFTEDEQKQITRLFGDHLNWNINSQSSPQDLDSSFVFGGHSDNPDKDYGKSSSDYVLDWHIEQIHYVTPPLGGVWYMKKFLCQPGTGQTVFIDSAELYETFSEEDRDFLSKSIIFWDKPVNTGKGPFYTKAVQEHPITGSPILRVEMDVGCSITPVLYSIDGGEPTKEQVQKFESMRIRIKDELLHNKSIKYSQEWETGDLLVVDFFRMYHAVLGGYKYNERIMTYIGTKALEYTNEMYTDPTMIDRI